MVFDRDAHMKPLKETNFTDFNKNFSSLKFCTRENSLFEQ